MQQQQQQEEQQRVMQQQQLQQQQLQLQQQQLQQQQLQQQQQQQMQQQQRVATAPMSGALAQLGALKASLSVPAPQRSSERLQTDTAAAVTRPDATAAAAASVQQTGGARGGRGGLSILEGLKQQLTSERVSEQKWLSANQSQHDAQMQDAERRAVELQRQHEELDAKATQMPGRSSLLPR